MNEYINRERARFEAKRYFKNMDEIQEDLDMLFCMLPAENVAPVRHGQWIIDSAGGKIACSDCRCIYLGHNGGLPPNYCPNCGAKMDGGADWMDVREKLVELLKVAPYNSFGNKLGECYFNSCLGLIADYLISNGVTVQGWISVDDELPKTGEYVVCTAKRNPFSRFMPMVARIEKNGWVNPMTEQYISEVTHWMPMTQPLKGE